MSSAAPEVESPITAGRLRAPYLRTATARHSRPRVVYFRGAAGDISGESLGITAPAHRWKLLERPISALDHNT